MNKVGLVAAGGLGGFLVAAAVGVVVVNLMLPWEDICAVLAPTQALIETGTVLLDRLQGWLIDAESLVAAGKTGVSDSAASGLSGIISSGIGKGVEIAAAPIEALIDVAQAVVAAVQATLDAAHAVVESVDSARC